MLIAHNGQTPYRIVMSHPADETVKHACDELHDFLYQVTGASFPVTTELNPIEGPELIVGDSGRVRDLGIVLSGVISKEESYLIRTAGEHLIIAGSTPRGTLYGVYAFLEEWAGCRWFSKDVSRVPRISELTVPPIDRIDFPAFQSREVYWREAFDGGFAVRNKLNANMADISSRQGGKLKFYNFHHSFDDLLPAELHYDTHPEYYSLVGGKRLRKQTQLCLTNPDVIRLCIAQVRQWIQHNPECRVFSVAQNDWDNHCTCGACMAIEELEGSPSGPIICFVNQIAQSVAKDWPDVLIHTFAYQYSRKAPRFVRPRENVIVRLCDIECCFSHPLDASLPKSARVIPREERRSRCQCATDGETDFLRDLREWSAICNRLYIWDYVTNFSHYLAPFPNLAALQANLQLFWRMGVAGVMEQGNYALGGGGNFSELQAYLQAKLLWNPDCSLQRHLDEFIDGFYGPDGAPYLQAYISIWQEAVQFYHMGINEEPDAPWINDTLLEKADSLLNHALFVTGDPKLRERIEKLQLGLTYLILCRMPAGTPGREALIDRFGWKLRTHGISEIHERWSLEEALEAIKHSGNLRDSKRRLRVDYKM